MVRRRPLACDTPLLASGRMAVVRPGPASCAEAEMLNAIRVSDASTPDVLAVEANVLIRKDLGDDMGLSGA